MILIPWLLGLVALALGMFRIGLLQIEATETAHQIARLAARADSLQVPAEFEDSAWDLEIEEAEAMVCVLVSQPELPLIEARACAPSLGR